LFSVNRLLCALAASLLVAAPALAQSPAKTRPNGAAQSAPAFTYDKSEAAMAFASDLAVRRNLDPAWVRQQIGQAQRLPTVIRLMQPAPTGTPKNWAAYRARFIDARRATLLGRQPRNTRPS
jgi:membrane-bound lytic murein transglycosylase B